MLWNQNLGGKQLDLQKFKKFLKVVVTILLKVQVEDCVVLGLLSSHILVPGSAMMTPAIGPCLPQYCLPWHDTRWPACQDVGLATLSLCCLPCYICSAGLPWSTACQDVCLARPLFILPSLHICSASLPQCWLATTYVQPVCHNAGLPKCQPTCSAGMPQC